MSTDDQVSTVPAGDPSGGEWTYPPTLLGRIGLGLCALAALLFVFTTDSPLAEQGLRTVSLSNSVIAYGVVLAVLVALTVAAPWIWARLVGVTLGAVIAGIAGAVVVGARGDDNFREGIDVSLGRSGVILVVAFFVAALGLLLALVGFRRAPPAGAVAEPPMGLPATSGKAIAALVLGLVGLILAPVGALAVGFALLARDDITLSGGARAGRGMAIAGLVLGIVDLVGWGLGLAIGMGSVNP